ncbi:hypothetical protein DTL72_24380 [Escherichia coli]|uniref:hypothetical protein n=2 Tax=Escherichia coli TaxID=562 RepID=UPI000DF29DA0|nr:hypothetical protein [Escherichia coli]RCY48421.1 hypothetical protein DTL72_24380 [Escherichia coli]RCZ80269.1 hypothetical protein DTM17_16585 [Escherichia coli]
MCSVGDLLPRSGGGMACQAAGKPWQAYASAPGCLAASGRQARLRQAAAGAPASLRRTRWRGFGLPLRSDV